MVAATSQYVARKIKVPFFGSGGCGDSKHLDEQAMVETTMSLFSSMVSGAHIIHDLGYMDHGVILSPQLLVLSNEIINHFACFHRGIDLLDADVWVSAIKSVGPGGNFLNEEMTLKNFKQVHYSEYFDRSMTDIPPPMGQKIKETTLELINDYKPKALSTDQMELIENNWNRWQKESCR